MEISGLEDVAGRRQPEHRHRLCISKGELASETAQIISSQESEATVQITVNQKATKLTETKLQRTFHAGIK